MGLSYDILIADDHPLFRSALRQALFAGLGDTISLNEVGSIEGLQAQLATRSHWDLVLLDLNMPGAYGFSGLAQLRGQFPHIPVIMISAQEESSVVRRAKDFGASGFIPKSATLETIQISVQTVLEGGVCWPEGLDDPQGMTSEQQQISSRVASLTPQQFRVLTMVCDGLLNKQIAYELDVSEATIKAHVTAIFRKLEVRTRTQAALALQQMELSKTG